MAFENFTPFHAAAGDADIFGVKGGAGPPLLLLHGHPQSHLIWRAAPRDWPSTSRSSQPICAATAHRASRRATRRTRRIPKRAMAAEQVAVMRHFGFERFLVCAHDRGARVAHRMALDHADAVERLMLLDIAPTLAMYEATDRTFATHYFHWFFLIQPEPLPETLIGANPGRVCRCGDGQPSRVARAVRTACARRVSRGARATRARCTRCARTTARPRASISNTIAPTSNADTRSACPLRVLWGDKGVIEVLRRARRMAPCGARRERAVAAVRPLLCRKSAPGELLAGNAVLLRSDRAVEREGGWCFARSTQAAALPRQAGAALPSTGRRCRRLRLRALGDLRQNLVKLIDRPQIKRQMKQSSPVTLSHSTNFRNSPDHFFHQMQLPRQRLDAHDGLQRDSRARADRAAPRSARSRLAPRVCRMRSAVLGAESPTSRAEFADRAARIFGERGEQRAIGFVERATGANGGKAFLS